MSEFAKNDFFKEKSDEIIKYRFSDPQKAYDSCCELLEHSAEYENMYEEAYARLYMSDTLFTLGKLKEATDMLLLAEKIQKQYGFDDLLMKTYNIMAILYVTQGDELLALDYYYQALDLAKAHKDFSQIAVLYNNIGALLYNVGKQTEAADYFDKAWKISQKSADKGIYDTRQLILNIGHKFIADGQYQKAKDYLDENLERFHEGEVCAPVTEIGMINTYVTVYYHLKDYEAVRKLCSELLDKLDELFGEAEVIKDLLGITRHLIEMGELDIAKRFLQHADHICENLELFGDRLCLCETWIQFYEAKKDDEALYRCYETYYEIRKHIKAETNKIIATALANRQQLEYQREANRQLSTDNRELIKKSETDELTGISNRYGLNKQFVKWSKLAQLKNQPICMGLFDIDYFKVYNDRYGHLNGDVCLQTVARILKEVAGDAYFVARYGGDEFIVLGIEKTDDEIIAFADQLFDRLQNERMPFKAHPSSDRLTISMGLVNRMIPAEYRISDMVHEADEMLYRVKKSGKNRYELSGTIFQ